MPTAAPERSPARRQAASRPGGGQGRQAPLSLSLSGGAPGSDVPPRPGVPGAGRAGPRSAAPTLASTGRPLVVGVAVAFSVCQLQSLPGLFPGVSVLGGSGLGPRAALRWRGGTRAHGARPRWPLAAVGRPGRVSV